MEKSIISEGKTTNEAIEKGLKKLNVSKESVDIRVIENEEKRSFFNILTPRVVKVELKIKENEKQHINTDMKIKKEVVLTDKEKEIAKQNIEKFMKDFIIHLPEDAKYEIETTKNGLNINLTSPKLGFLIGYRGETLYSLQNILTNIASKGLEKRVTLILDIEGYKKKREKTLEELAEKVAKTVIKTEKPIRLEPMQAYERKIIHAKLQENIKIETVSFGEEPYRRIIVSLKNR